MDLAVEASRSPSTFAGAFSPSTRLARLRATLLHAEYRLCTQKAELLTRYFREEVGESRLTRALARLCERFMNKRRAKARGMGETFVPSHSSLTMAIQRLWMGLDHFHRSDPPVVLFAGALRYILERVPLTIYDDELVVGNLTSQRIGAPIHPDLGGLMMSSELDGLDHRAVNPIETDPQQLDRLKADVLPYWLPRAVMSLVPLVANDARLPQRLIGGTPVVLTQFAGVSHLTPDYPTVLERGFSSLAADAGNRRRAARTAEQRAFYGAAEIVARAAVDFGDRWRRHCDWAASRATDAKRAAELHQLARVFAHVPARPARTFHEAVQSVFITHMIVHQESFQHAVSLGRLDQYLYPYYRTDVDEGRLTSEEALELVGCLLAKLAEVLPLFNGIATDYFSGLSAACGITLGGVDRHGNDASNELTAIILAAYDQLRLRQPNIHLRVHSKTPARLLSDAHEIIKRGGGMPALFNDSAVIEAVMETGATLEDARSYSIVGCVEWSVPGKTFPAAGAAFVSLPAVLVNALNHSQEPDEFQVVRDCETMDEIMMAFKRELAAVVSTLVADNNAIELTHARYRPTPFLSLLVEGCLATGREVNAGGAIYNSTGVQGVGLADVADSLAAIEQLVFVEQSVSLRHLLHAIRHNFADDSELLARLSHKVAKYGEDQGSAEVWARRVAEVFCDLVHQHDNPRGGRYLAGFWSMTTHVGFGHRLGALPSGRRARTPIANGVSPVNGADRRGPTASMMAAAQIAGPHVTNGLCLNEKVAPWAVEGIGGTALLVGLTRGYFAAGGMQVQYNILNPDELIDAKKHPERHRGLVVRISGYSAYFNDLTDAMKDELIERSLHAL